MRVRTRASTAVGALRWSAETSRRDQPNLRGGREMGWRVISVGGRPDTHAGKTRWGRLWMVVSEEREEAGRSRVKGQNFGRAGPSVHHSTEQCQQRQRFSILSNELERPLVLRQDYYSYYHDHSIQSKTQAHGRPVRDYRLVAKDSLFCSAFTHTPASSFRCCSHNRPRRQILDAECFLAQRPGTAPAISSWQQTLLRADGQVRCKQRGLSLRWPSMPSYMPLILSPSLLLGTAPSRQPTHSH